MSKLKNQIIADMKTAMKAKDKLALITIRMLLAAIKQKEIDGRIELTDIDVVVIVKKMIKQRKDSIIQFTNAGRDELATAEAKEIAVIETYMPQQMNDTQINQIIQNSISDMNNPSMADMGKIMASLKVQLVGKADMGLVNKLLKMQLK